MTAVIAIPLDPMDVEQLPPADLDTCHACRGTGVVDAFDPQDVRDCSTCRGEGVLP